MKKKLYIICNSHIDPVWLWNRSAGRSTWLNTMHSVVRIMEEEPDLKFNCSSAALYRYVEECDPALFRKIRRFVNEKRWDIVGGWEVQSDVILSRPVTLYHQAESAKKYFLDRFGADVKIAYNVDAFGHSAGLPKILNETGFQYYVYTRSHTTPSLFRWQSEDGSSVIALHIINSYGTSGSEMFLKQHFNKNLKSPLEHQAVFFGIGDHGGGISRKELALIREWQQDYDIVFATLSEYFDAVKDMPLETVTGELGPVFRGCYSNCHEVKRKIARAVRRLETAEKLGVSSAELQEPWQELCFNHFHDILPGTSIREAFEKDIFTGIGSVEHHADKLIDRQIFRRTSELDTMYMPEGGIYCWNPHPFEHKTVMGFNGFADPNRNGVFFNVLRDEDGNEIPLQFLPSDSTFGPFGDAWGKITAVIDLPPTGEKTFAYGVSAKDYPKVGFERQKKLLKNLALEVFFDNTRTWGFDLIQINNKLGNMELVHTEEYCNGPVCSILRAVYRFRNSEVRLDIYDYIGIQEIGVKVRLDWQETMSCMKLSWAHKCVNPDFYTGSCAAAVCRLSKNDYGPAKEWSNGSMITKLPSTQEFSMIDWCAAAADGKIAAFFAADIHSCDHADNRMRLTLVRPVLYADHAPFARKDDDGWMDLGIGFRSFWIAEYDQLPLSSLQKKSIARLNNGEVREITAHEAGDPRGYCEFMKFELAEEQLTVQELRRNDDCETEIRLLNSGEAISLNLPEIGKTEIPAFALRTFKWKNNDISADA